MRSYNPKEWKTIILDFHKSDTLRKLIPVLLASGVYAFAVAYIEKHYIDPRRIKEIQGLTVIHTLLSFVISMLLVFRTNTAYDRWWEGRKLWGSLVNNSRNLALKLNVMLEQEDRASRMFF